MSSTLETEDDTDKTQRWEGRDVTRLQAPHAGLQLWPPPPGITKPPNHRPTDSQPVSSSGSVLTLESKIYGNGLTDKNVVLLK